VRHSCGGNSIFYMSRSNLRLIQQKMSVLPYHAFRCYPFRIVANKHVCEMSAVMDLLWHLPRVKFLQRTQSCLETRFVEVRKGIPFTCVEADFMRCGWQVRICKKLHHITYQSLRQSHIFNGKMHTRKYRENIWNWGNICPAVVVLLESCSSGFPVLKSLILIGRPNKQTCSLRLARGSAESWVIMGIYSPPTSSCIAITKRP
jgi:hypothetical protein